MRTIIQKDDPILRKIAKEIPVKDIHGVKIKKLIADMKELLATQEDGIAMAAPQVGQSIRLFIVSGAVMKMSDPKYKGDDSSLIFINPKITKLSREKQELEEGCLSVRWKYGRIKRSRKATIKAHDENGRIFERGASGLLAQIFQHEMDHLEGVLFTDKAYDLKDMPPPEKKMDKKNPHIEHAEKKSSK